MRWVLCNVIEQGRETCSVKTIDSSMSCYFTFRPNVNIKSLPFLYCDVFQLLRYMRFGSLKSVRVDWAVGLYLLACHEAVFRRHNVFRFLQVVFGVSLCHTSRATVCFRWLGEAGCPLAAQCQTSLISNQTFYIFRLLIVLTFLLLTFFTCRPLALSAFGF